MCRGRRFWGKEDYGDTQTSLNLLSNLLNLAALERLFMFVLRDWCWDGAKGSSRDV